MLILDNSLRVRTILLGYIIRILTATKPILNQAEVAALFSHPLNSFLHSDPPFATEPEMLEMKYHTYMDLNSNTMPGKVRMHNFLTGREAGGTKPIFGLTACVAFLATMNALALRTLDNRSILIRVASIGYGQQPDFEPYAPEEPTMQQRIAYALRHDPIFREAEIAEGIDPDKTPDPSSLVDSSQPGAEVKRTRRRRRRVRAKL